MTTKQIKDLTLRTALVDTDQFPLDDASNATWKTTLADIRKKLFASPAQGDLLYYNGSDWVRLAAGTAGQLLMTKGASQNPAWANVGLTEGQMRNGKISATVASNNLTVALKTLAGNDPSATDPVIIRLGDTVLFITAALSVTKNAGTGYFNAGSAELATKEIDYFVYLGYNATDGVVIGFARIPFGRIYSDFNTTNTNEKYCAISTITNAAASDPYQVIGRFAATLSAGAGYTWSVPTYTAANLIQRPIYETRWLDWTPAQSGEGSLTWTSPTINVAKYKLEGTAKLLWEASVSATLGGSAANSLYLTVPFEAARSANFIACGAGFAGAVTGTVWITPASPDKITVDKYDASNYATSGSLTLDVAGFYEV